MAPQSLRANDGYVPGQALKNHNKRAVYLATLTEENLYAINSQYQPSRDHKRKLQSRILNWQYSCNKFQDLTTVVSRERSLSPGFDIEGGVSQDMYCDCEALNKEVDMEDLRWVSDVDDESSMETESFAEESYGIGLFDQLIEWAEFFEDLLVRIRIEHIHVGVIIILSLLVLWLILIWIDEGIRVLQIRYWGWRKLMEL